ncbi:P2Y purinoceptor 3 [Osmerus eperlanus]|uniref:P2Y purinoceptor 3 n=1 Tax=Osmerus eperlanus TaxID=29151 RepID=UPI002E15A0A6
MQLFPLEVFPTGTFSTQTFSSELYSDEDLYLSETYEQDDVYNATRPIHPRCTYKEDFKRILLPAVYTAVFLVGLPLNAVVMLKISRTRTNLSRSNIYMLNLATADFLYVLSLPLLIYNYASHDYWPFGELACKLVRFQFYSNLHGSILFLTCISLQRYLGICHPLASWHKQGGRRLAWRVCLAVWLVVAVLCAPTLHFAATGKQRNRTVCYDMSPPDRSSSYYPYGMALTCLGFLLPFTAVVACYCRMACILCRPATCGDVSVAAGAKRDRAVRMIVVVVAVFAISFLPFHVTKTMYLLVRTLPGAPCHTRNLFSIVYKCTRPFASMNSVLDPILFYFTQPRFRKSTRKLVLKVTSHRTKGTQV